MTLGAYKGVVVLLSLSMCLHKFLSPHASACTRGWANLQIRHLNLPHPDIVPTPNASLLQLRTFKSPLQSRSCSLEIRERKTAVLWCLAGQNPLCYAPALKFRGAGGHQGFLETTGLPSPVETHIQENVEDACVPVYGKH